MGENPGGRRAALRIALGAAVVVAGLAAVLLIVLIVLDQYPPIAPDGTTPGDDRSAAVIAVLTPALTALGAIVALYFGVSATGSARGHEAEARLREATTAHRAAAPAVAPATTVVVTPDDPTPTAPAGGDADAIPHVPAHTGDVPPDQGDGGKP